jgi:hypothetical protein
MNNAPFIKPLTKQLQGPEESKPTQTDAKAQIKKLKHPSLDSAVDHLATWLKKKYS